MIRVIMAMCIAFVANATSYSQLENSYWFFGDSLKIQFLEDSALVTKVNLKSKVCSSIYSDNMGELVLFSNGAYVLDASGDTINSDMLLVGELYEDTIWGGDFKNQSVILPSPLDIKSYYILNIYSGIYSSIIYYDSLLYKFSVLIEQSNIPRGGLSLGYRLAATKHANGRDWWVVSRASEYYDPLQPFLVWRIDPDGFHGPENQFPDPDPDGFNNNLSTQLIFSEQGNRLALINHNYVDLYSFDRCSGEVSFDCRVFVTNGAVSSCAFSPNGDYLYVAENRYEINSTSKIFQLYVGGSVDCSTIESSKQQIFSESYEDWDGMELLLERVSGAIYFILLSRTSWPHEVYAEQNTHLHAIHQPNLEGALCDVEENALYLDGLRSLGGLPNMPNYTLGALQGSPCDTLDTANVLTEPLLSAFQMYPNPVTELLNIYNPLHSTCMAKVFNPQGQAIQSFLLQPGNQVVDVSAWPQGSYSLVVYEEEKLVWSSTLVKMEL